MSRFSTSAKLPVAVDPGRLKEVACYLCGCPDHRVRFVEGPIRLVECRACRLVYITPQLAAEDLAELYQESYWQSECARDYGYMDYVKDGELYIRSFRKRIRNVTAYRTGGKLLDVGCAAGFFLHVAREAGFDYHGVDVAAPMVRFARETLGLENIREGTLEAAGYPEGTFDVVTLWDVVEHLADPVAVLRECRRVLRPDGILVLETQNVRSPVARLLGRRWHHFKMLEHLYHFDPDTGTALLEKAGFGVVRWTRRRAGKYVSMAFLVERSGRLARFLPKLLAPLARIGPAALYVNPLDEMVFVARPE